MDIVDNSVINIKKNNMIVRRYEVKKIIYAVTAAAILFAGSGCSKDEEEEKSYAEKLVSGEIQPDVEYADPDDTEDEKETSEPAKANHNDNNTDDAAPATEAVVATKVNLGITDAEMAGYIDQAAEEYSSFEYQPIGSADFFLNKNLKMAASVSNHELSNVYAANIITSFTNDSMKMSYETDGQTVSGEYYVYTVSNEVKTTPNGNEYTYVAYGDQPITSSETDGTIGVVARVKLPESVDMGDAAADSYVFLIETSNPGVYELFKEE